MIKKLNTIMLIDDNDGDNYIHNKIIAKANITESIIVMDTAYKALDFLKENVDLEIDIIFLDINMPIMDGIEFLKKYNELNLKKCNVFIMLTTSMHEEEKKESMQYGAKDFISKPLTPTALDTILKKYYEN